MKDRSEDEADADGKMELWGNIQLLENQGTKEQEVSIVG